MEYYLTMYRKAHDMALDVENILTQVDGSDASTTLQARALRGRLREMIFREDLERSTREHAAMAVEGLKDET